MSTVALAIRAEQQNGLRVVAPELHLSLLILINFRPAINKQFQTYQNLAESAFLKLFFAWYNLWKTLFKESALKCFITDMY